MGNIDEVRVWNFARTAGQIRENYQRSLDGTETGLVGWWNFDDSANPGKDRSRGGHHGKVVGNAVVVPTTRLSTPPTVAQAFTAQTGPKEMVLQLDGQASYVELPPGLVQSLDIATVEGWVRWDAFTTNAHFFEFSSRDHSLYVTEFNGTQAELNDTRNLAALLSSGKPWNYQRLAAENSLAAGQWNHVAVVTGRNGFKLYLNGALVETNDLRASLWRR